MTYSVAVYWVAKQMASRLRSRRGNHADAGYFMSSAYI